MTRATNLYRHQAYKTWADRQAASDDVLVDTPDPVTGFTAVTNGATAMNLAWTNSADGAGALLQIERAPAAGAGGAVANTFTDAGNLVGLVAHGFANGTRVMFDTIVTTTGILVDTSYYVINATADDFQVAQTVGGAAMVLTTNGTGTVFAPTFTYAVIDIVEADDEVYADSGLTTSVEYQYRVSVLRQVPQTAAAPVAFDRTD